MHLLVTSTPLGIHILYFTVNWQLIRLQNSM